MEVRGRTPASTGILLLVTDARGPRTPWGSLLAMGMIAFTMAWVSSIVTNAHRGPTVRIVAAAYLVFGAWLLWQRWRSIPRRVRHDQTRARNGVGSSDASE